MYRMYGDERLLERHFDAAARAAEFVSERNPDGLWLEARGNDYGDWVPAGEETDKTMFATLHHYRSVRLLVEMAEALNRTRDAERWQERADLVRAAFNERYLRDGHYEDATQTVNALALAFGIVPEEHRASVAADLVADIRERDVHLSCGFSGTQWLLPVLCREGYAELAHQLLLNRDYPSWGYMVEQGATTIWERWNSDSEGPAMNSRNHFAYGSVGQWLFAGLAGIAPDDDVPGFERVVVRPYPGDADGELSAVRANYDSLRGPIETAWEVSPEGLDLAVRVPANATAVVYVPAEDPARVTEGGLPLGEAEAVELVGTEPGRVVCAVGAGLYRFAVRR
jgi:alpha-L-rhamnosidase